MQEFFFSHWITAILDKRGQHFNKVFSPPKCLILRVLVKGLFEGFHLVQSYTRVCFTGNNIEQLGFTMDSTVKVFLSILLTFNFNHKSDSSVSKSLTKNGLLDTMNSSKANSVVKKVYPQVETVVGSSVELPCNTSSPTDDSVQLILWFKSAYGTGPPFLKLDARSSNSLETASITLASEYENRIYFNLSSSPSILNINPVREEDASIYSCRVDYKWSRTSISNINLFIIVPPNDVIISDPQSGLRLGQIAGPYPEDSQLKLNCIAIGGKPAPQLVWYLDNQLIDDSYHFNNETFQVVNELVIDKLKRSHPDSVLTCKATNHITIPRISASTRLELYFFANLLFFVIERY
uniref:Ig-like domain-containing protein n=1 Tax=Tetranychus urticae TaxID=32264 RepID=T1KCX8_TETUR